MPASSPSHAESLPPRGAPDASGRRGAGCGLLLAALALAGAGPAVAGARAAGPAAAGGPVAHVPTGPRRPVGLWEPDARAAIAYARGRRGEVSFAVRTEHRTWGWRATRTVPSTSLLKAMLLVAYLDDPRVRDRPLAAADHRLIDPMIQRSDNTAATRVLGFVGAAGVYRVAHRAGMRSFTLDSVIWGLSRTSAGDQTRFFLHIDREVVGRHRATAMHLLATVTSSQHWGIGQLRLPGWQLYFKGGWGAGTGEVEHQVALLRHGATRLSVAVLITSSPSHAYAKQTLRGVFAALLRGVGSLLPRAGRADARALLAR
jgi:Beta-lactamase enzyme family